MNRGEYKRARREQARVRSFVVDDGDPDVLQVVTILSPPATLESSTRAIRDAVVASGAEIVGVLDGDAEHEAWDRRHQIGGDA